LKILVELPNHDGAEHALVHDGAAGKRAHVEVLGDARHGGVARGGGAQRVAPQVEECEKSKGLEPGFSLDMYA
jgi:hypothetical protein